MTDGVISAHPPTYSPWATILICALTWLANGGAGIVASILMDEATLRWWLPVERPRRRWVRSFYRHLHSPAHKRRTALVLAAAVSGLAGALVAFVSAVATGQGWEAALAAAVGVVVGLVANQVYHGDKTLKKEQVWDE